MAQGMYFTPSSFTPAMYDDVIQRLEAAGAGAPAGRSYHVALETDGQIQVFDAQNTLLQAVTSNRVDAAALTNISLNDVVAKNPGSGVEVTRGFFPTINGQQTVSAGAFVFRTADADFVAAFNTELATLHQNGEWLRIAQPFGFTEDNIPGADVTTRSLCAA